MPRELLFSVTRNDLRMDTFRAGGKGGQKQNKTDSGVRFTHAPSGAVGESREARTQLENKRLAFKRLVESSKFEAWRRREAARLLVSAEERQREEERIQRRVAEALRPENIKVEALGPHGWEPADA